MPTPPLELLSILEHYVAGYFPMVEPPDGGGKAEFYWDRWPVRAVLAVNGQTVARARRMTRRTQARGAFEIRYTTAVEEVIAQLQTVKENSWVQGEVVAIYRALYAAGVLQTVEAWACGGPSTDGAGGAPRLVGALLGLILPGTFVAETMYGLVPEASKICLCRLVEDCAAAGFEMIDVQTPHDAGVDGEPGSHGATGTAHPCIRLGESRVALEEFLERLTAAWARHFSGDVPAWLELAGTLRPGASAEVAASDPRRFLRHAGRPSR